MHLREAEHSSYFRWLGSLTLRERRTFVACAGGWALDAMDVQLYSLAIPALIATWGITTEQAGLLGTITLLVSAIGGWIAGYLSDRIGRVRTLQITILWFALFTFLSGLAQTYEQLFVARAVMGLGFGGEWAAGAVLLGEVIRPEHRGKALGLMQAGWAIGWGAAALLYAWLFTVLPQETAWRALFLCGILPAFLVFFVRRFVEEPEVYARAKSKSVGSTAALSEIFRPPFLRITVLGSILSTGAQGGYYAVMTFLPAYLRQERKLTVLDSAGYLSVLIAGAFCGYVSAGICADCLGRRLTFILFAIGAGAVAVSYTMLPLSDRTMLVCGFPLGFFASGVFSAMGPFFTEHFPTRIRGAGQGFAYNAGRATGALFPTLVAILAARITLGQSIGIFAGSAYAIMAIAALLLPETRGKALES